MKRLLLIIALAVLTVGLLPALAGCGPQTLPPGEVREYQGEKMDSISDFRENSIKGPQYVDIAAYRLKVTGLVNNPKEYTYDEVINQNQLYKKVVTLDCVEGWSVKILWEGVLFRDLVKEAQVQPAAKIAIFRAHDGYSTSSTIDYLMSKDIMVAYKMNEAVIPPERGYPLMLVAESKWGYKWCKWITEVELSSDVDFRGFWERAGYSNDGDLDKYFLE